MADELSPSQTFSQPCYSKSVDRFPLEEGEQLYSCVYRDFGKWRPVADYRNAKVWIKFASMQTTDNKSEAEQKADLLVDELMTILRDKKG